MYIYIDTEYIHIRILNTVREEGVNVMTLCYCRLVLKNSKE